MAIAPNLTFVYKLAVEERGLSRPEEAIYFLNAIRDPADQTLAWRGQGSGRSQFMNTEGMLGPRPRFVLCTGWLTLRTSDQWTHSLPVRWFSDYHSRQPGNSELPLLLEDQNKTLEAAGPSRLPDRGRTASEATPPDPRDCRNRNLASYSLYVGEALGRVLHVGDELNFSRNGNADFGYSVRRYSETIFSAGSVGFEDEGGPFAITQEYDLRPNIYAESFQAKYAPIKVRVPETIRVNRPHVTARIGDRNFHLLDGEVARVDPYYVFLARSNRSVPPISFEFTPRAVHAGGRLDIVSKELIVDAARQLTKYKTILL